MAGETLQSVLSALPFILQPQIQRQWNRTTYFLGTLNATPGRIEVGEGKSANFVTEFSGATAGTVAEGSDVATSEFNSDVNIPATFPWATYRSSFQISEQELDAARLANGSATAMVDLFGERVLGCAAQIAKSIETDALTGTGVDSSGNPTLVGVFGGALAASGNYGGISRTTYTEWAGNVTSNGGVSRTLTPDLLGQVDQNIFTASSLPWDLIITSAGVTRKYEAFFSNSGASGLGVPLVRMNDNAGMPVYGLGVPNDNQMQLATLYYKGKPVIRNPWAPTGKLALLNTSHVKIKYLPYVPKANEKMFLQMLGLEGSTGGSSPVQATGIPMRIAELAKTGDSVKVTMRATVAMCVTRPNSCGLLTDVSEA